MSLVISYEHFAGVRWSSWTSRFSYTWTGENVVDPCMASGDQWSTISRHENAMLNRDPIDGGFLDHPISISCKTATQGLKWAHSMVQRDSGSFLRDLKMTLRGNKQAGQGWCIPKSLVINDSDTMYQNFNDLQFTYKDIQMIYCRQRYSCWNLNPIVQILLSNIHQGTTSNWTNMWQCSLNFESHSISILGTKTDVDGTGWLELECSWICFNIKNSRLTE